MKHQERKHHNFQPMCSISGRTGFLFCTNADCHEPAFVCDLNDQCASVHKRHEQTEFRDWRQYALPLRLAMEVEAHFDDSVDAIQLEQKESIDSNAEIKEGFSRLVGEARWRVLESSGVFATIKLIREGKYSQVTGRRMGQLIRAFDNEDYKTARGRVDQQLASIKETLKNLAGKHQHEVQAPAANQADNFWKCVWLIPFIAIMLSIIGFEADQQDNIPWNSQTNNTCTPSNRWARNEDTQLFRDGSLSCRLNNTDGIYVCIRSTGEQLEEHIAKASIDINQQQYHLAIEELNQVIEKNPGFSYSYYLRAKAFIRLGKFNRAVRDLDSAIQMQPSSVAYLRERAFAYRKLRRFDEALRNFDQALQIDQNNPKIFRDRGVLLYNMNRFAESIEEFAKARAITMDPTNEFYASLAYYALGRFEDALTCVNKAITIKSFNPDYYERRSMILVKLGRRREAIESKRQANRLQSD